MTRALVLIDLQPRIVALSLAPHTGDDVVRRAFRLAEAHRAAGLPVVLVRTDRPGVPEQPPGSELVEGLAQPGDVIVVKHTIGGFHETDLHERLQEAGAATLAFAGIVTNMGVESTARAASDHDYELEFVSDAMSGFTAEEHDLAVNRVFPRFGTVLTTDELIAKL
ncbi:isochorismatase family protein [Bailinhaonella thermotolerans]|uniref:Isochorismatase family protein n=1 Tax=Bailinhaonella thermotolerans TaxID=1070861 RepID=A0A3A4ADT5_9ACTN|nr:isochorismatase family protein [Bailinhaonella thermotolerans]RJL24210.1 isochorismatase family protein [Bailinhaonella thermotolerans]